jgi:primosomal protein DnaI
MKGANEILSKNYKKELESTLMTNFREALKDPTFEKLVGKLKLTYEELSKYTTTLEDCSLEYSNCLKCKGLIACKNKINGHAYLPEVKNGKLRFGYKPCKFMLKYNQEYSYLKNIYTLEEPKDICIAKFSDIDLKDEARIPIIKYLTEFITNYRDNKECKGLYLHGSFGSGKTYLISASFNELAKDNVKSAIIFWPAYLTELKSSFGTDEFKEKLDKIKKAELLLIDDLGAENTTPWSRDDVLCPILQYRMEEKLPTFFTSNFTLEELEVHLATSSSGYEIVKSKRILERIKQLTNQLELSSKNLRK